MRLDLEGKLVVGAMSLLVIVWCLVMGMTGESFWDFKIDSSDRIPTPNLTTETADLP